MAYDRNDEEKTRKHCCFIVNTNVNTNMSRVPPLCSTSLPTADGSPAGQHRGTLSLKTFGVCGWQEGQSVVLCLVSGLCNWRIKHPPRGGVRARKKSMRREGRACVLPLVLSGGNKEHQNCCNSAFANTRFPPESLLWDTNANEPCCLPRRSSLTWLPP